MPERITITIPPGAVPTLEPDAQIGVRGFPARIVSATANADDPELVDLTVDVDVPDDQAHWVQDSPADSLTP